MSNLINDLSKICHIMPFPCQKHLYFFPALQIKLQFFILEFRATYYLVSISPDFSSSPCCFSHCSRDGRFSCQERIKLAPAIGSLSMLIFSEKKKLIFPWVSCVTDSCFLSDFLLKVNWVDRLPLNTESK